MPARSHPQQVPIPNDDCRSHQCKEGDPQEEFREHADVPPLLEEDTPQGPEDDDACHMDGSTREPIVSHLRLDHRVEEELEVPGCPASCTTLEPTSSVCQQCRLIVTFAIAASATSVFTPNAAYASLARWYAASRDFFAIKVLPFGCELLRLSGSRLRIVW